MTPRQFWTVVMVAGATATVASAQQRTGGTPGIPPIDRSGYPIYDRGSPNVEFNEVSTEEPPLPGPATADDPVMIYGAGLAPFGRMFGYVETSGNTILDDYSGAAGTTGMLLQDVYLIGGSVGQIAGGSGGTLIWVDFLDAFGAHLGGFGVDLGAHGDFIYRFTPDVSDAVLFDNIGFIMITGDDGTVSGMETTFRWWYTDLADYGTSAGGLPAAGSWDSTVYTMMLNAGGTIPAPAAALLLGASGLIAGARRRR